MRVLYLHQYFVPPDGSGGSRSYEFARRLARAGHDVRLITTTANFPSRYRWAGPVTTTECDGIKLTILDVPYANAMGFSRRLVAFADFAWRCTAEAVKQKAVDVIFATSTPLTVALPGMIASAVKGVPFVFEVRDLWPAVPIALGALKSRIGIHVAERLEAAAYRRAAKVVALSPGMRDGIVRAGCPAEKVVVIPNCANPALFSVDRDKGARLARSFVGGGPGPIVLYAGTAGKVNGLSHLVDVAIAAESISPEVRFLIVGGGGEWEAVRSHARRGRVLGRTLFMHPPVPKGDVAALLAGADVATSFVANVPALWDNSANKVFDALAAGVPLMINYGGWQAELLSSAGAGIVIPPNAAAEGAAMLCAFLKNENRVNTARAAARELSQMFDVDVLAEQLARTLEDVVRERTNSG